MTVKHQRVLRVDTYDCACGKTYKYRQGLFTHKKTCARTSSTAAIQPEEGSTVQGIQTLTSLVTELVKNNAELQRQITELCKTGPVIINNGTINHKSFNINVFLNEKCGNAMNLSDFVKQIQVSREDLENTAQLGFVNGMSKIFIDNLKQLDIHERPIHCTDVKRETIYVRSDNKWNKEDDDTKLRNAIQEISRKSVGTLIGWKKENPDYADGDSEFSQLCIPMLRNSIAGDDRDVFYPKAVRTVLKNITLAK